MTEEELTGEYLAKFPTILRKTLEENPKHRRRFLNRVQTEYEDLTVFRAIHRADSIEDDDFLCNMEEAQIYDREYKRKSLELYGISVNEDPMQIVKSLSIPNVRHPALAVAKGKMKKDYGPADFVEGATHHNWYLFAEKIPLLKNEFQMIGLNEVVKKGDESDGKSGYLG